ncbi:MAG: ABC-F family ATP-binding cassette domain-containing protein [Lachnospiraceae bacterium]|nr:ABC-F family ATP-binding cassette domain-containing protein [Lachnospiraceae bacterium]
MLYQIMNGTVSVGGQTILSHIDFEIKGKEKIAVVGRNGAGKTTLLRLIAGELELDRDDRQTVQGIRTSRHVTIGMLHQNQQQDQDKTVEELLLSGFRDKDTFGRERFAYEMEYDRIFLGFGFQKADKKRRLSSFSGGEQTKLSLISLLLMKPDILLLDEPTNHLDIPTVEWLEGYMREYEQAVVFVSHDRFFLDKVVDVVYELSGGKLNRYPGSYTNYRQEKRKRAHLQKKAYERQQAEIDRMNQLVEKFKHKPKKAAFARSRKTMMQRMQRIEKPEMDDTHIFTGALEPLMPGPKWVLEAEHLKIGYDKVLLELSLRVRRGQKIGIIGDNGAGKSTFLKTVAGEVLPISGKCEPGSHILMGYFDQQSASIQSEKHVLEHFHDLFPGMTEKEVRQSLGAYLFSGTDDAKMVNALSGGEKARLVLAELLTGRPNLLVLDEPTNHMDIQAKETLESAFQAYTGTILFVSHDRYFIRQIADAILVFEGQSVMYYPFGYEHYLERRQKQKGENPSALIRAEEQALIADFKAVPKAERHRLREISTEEAYRDWRMRLVTEPMEKARTQVEELTKQWEKLQVELEESRWIGTERDPGKKQQQEQAERLKLELEKYQEQWTTCCLAWWDEKNVE